MALDRPSRRAPRLATASLLLALVACSSGPGVDEVVPPTTPEPGDSVNPLITDTTGPPPTVTDSTG